MASIDRSDPVILGHVLAEHHELFCQMMAVRSAFADKAAVSQGRVDATLVALHALREHLRCHFEKEEEGGYSTGANATKEEERERERKRKKGEAKN